MVAGWMSLYGRNSLNAPYGARCFLTIGDYITKKEGKPVLMHLMALGAF